MAKCKYCGKSGWTLPVTKEGLCKSCNFVVYSTVARYVQIIKESIELVEQSKNLKTRLGRCDDIINFAQQLMEYERLGIPTTTIKPSKIVEEYRREKDKVLISGLDELLKQAQIKSSTATTLSAKVTPFSKLLLAARDYRSEASQPALLDSFTGQLITLLDTTQLNFHLAEADKAQFKGQRKKALEKYQEALYFIKNDKTPDSQQTKDIASIEARIAELGTVVDAGRGATAAQAPVVRSQG